MSSSILALDLAPMTQMLSIAVRPLLGLGMFAALLMVFKPIINGLLKAAWLLITPRKSLQQRNKKNKYQGWLMLHRLARNYQDTHPGLARELQAIAARND